MVVVPRRVLERQDARVVGSLAELRSARRSLYLADGAEEDDVGSSRSALLPFAFALFPVAQSAATGMVVALGFGVTAAAVAPELQGSVAELEVDLPDLDVPVWATPTAVRLVLAAGTGDYELLADPGARVLERVRAHARDEGLAFVQSSSPAAREVQPDGTVTSRYLVLADGAGQAREAPSKQALEERYNVEIDATFGGLLSGFVTARTARSAALDLSRRQDVALVEEDARFVGTTARATDQASPSERVEEDDRECADTLPWNLDRIDQRDRPLDCAYEPVGRGAGVDVYVLDTGVAEDHPELDPRVDTGFDALTGDEERTRKDCHGHGTAVASVIAGQTLGVANQAVVVPVRVMDCRGRYDVSSLVKALNWVRAAHEESGGPSVVNFSAEEAIPPHLSQTLHLAVQGLVSSGIPFITAAGNGGCAADSIAPARFNSALTVGSTTFGDHKDPDSNFGTCVDLHAPGQGVLTAHPLRDNGLLSGTSFAAPHVAGAAAIHLGRRPDAPPAQVRQALLGGATEGRIQHLPSDGGPNRLLYVGPEWL
jgi:subtilisin family serine protease